MDQQMGDGAHEGRACASLRHQDDAPVPLACWPASPALLNAVGASRMRAAQSQWPGRGPAAPASIVVLRLCAPVTAAGRSFRSDLSLLQPPALLLELNRSGVCSSPRRTQCVPSEAREDGATLTGRTPRSSDRTPPTRPACTALLSCLPSVLVAAAVRETLGQENREGQRQLLQSSAFLSSGTPCRDHLPEEETKVRDAHTHRRTRCTTESAVSLSCGIREALQTSLCHPTDLFQRARLRAQRLTIATIFGAECFGLRPSCVPFLLRRWL
jgi:hypothetical protein